MTPFAEFDSFRFFERNLESEGDVVGDVGRSDGEDFEGDGDVVFVDDDGDGLGADVGEDTPGHALGFGERDKRGGDGCGTRVNHVDAGFFDGADEVI